MLKLDNLTAHVAECVKKILSDGHVLLIHFPSQTAKSAQLIDAGCGRSIIWDLILPPSCPSSMFIILALKNVHFVIVLAVTLLKQTHHTCQCRQFVAASIICVDETLITFNILNSNEHVEAVQRTREGKQIGYAS